MVDNKQSPEDAIAGHINFFRDLSENLEKIVQKTFSLDDSLDVDFLSKLNSCPSRCKALSRLQQNQAICATLRDIEELATFLSVVCKSTPILPADLSKPTTYLLLILLGAISGAGLVLHFWFGIGAAASPLEFVKTTVSWPVLSAFLLFFLVFWFLCKRAAKVASCQLKILIKELDDQLTGIVSNSSTAQSAGSTDAALLQPKWWKLVTSKIGNLNRRFNHKIITNCRFVFGSIPGFSALIFGILAGCWQMIPQKGCVVMKDSSRSGQILMLGSYVVIAHLKSELRTTSLIPTKDVLEIKSGEYCPPPPPPPPPPKDGPIALCPAVNVEVNLEQIKRELTAIASRPVIVYGRIDSQTTEAFREIAEKMARQQHVTTMAWSSKVSDAASGIKDEISGVEDQLQRMNLLTEEMRTRHMFQRLGEVAFGKDPKTDIKQEKAER